jgi:hypothetical protein
MCNPTLATSLGIVFGAVLSLPDNKAKDKQNADL